MYFFFSQMSLQSKGTWTSKHSKCSWHKLKTVNKTHKRKKIDDILKIHMPHKTDWTGYNGGMCDVTGQLKLNRSTTGNI